jgi:hypothetical protein
VLPLLNFLFPVFFTMVAEVEIIMTAFRELVVREWRGWKLD